MANRLVMMSLACVAVVWLMPSCFVPFLAPLPHAPRIAPNLPLPEVNAAAAGGNRKFDVVAISIGFGLLVGVLGAPSAARAMPTGIVEVNELWHSHDLKSHWISFDRRMEIAAEKDVKELDKYVEDRRLMKEARANSDVLKQQRVANYKNKVSVADLEQADPAVHDKQPVPAFKPETLAGGPIRIPYLGEPMPSEPDMDF